MPHWSVNRMPQFRSLILSSVLVTLMGVYRSRPHPLYFEEFVPFVQTRPNPSPISIHAAAVISEQEPQLIRKLRFDGSNNLDVEVEASRLQRLTFLNAQTMP
jgi:hypothetical protein